MIQKIFIGSDHGGFDLKSQVILFLSEHYPQILVEDVGCNSSESCDFQTFGDALSQKVLSENSAETVKGIAICGSGIGISIACNRHKGVHAALCNSVQLAELSQEHNGANVLVMGGRTAFIDSPQKIVCAFLETVMNPEDRYLRRKNDLDS